MAGKKFGANLASYIGPVFFFPPPTINVWDEHDVMSMSSSLPSNDYKKNNERTPFLGSESPCSIVQLISVYSENLYGYLLSHLKKLSVLVSRKNVGFWFLLVSLKYTGNPYYCEGFLHFLLLLISPAEVAYLITFSIIPYTGNLRFRGTEDTRQ